MGGYFSQPEQAPEAHLWIQETHWAVPDEDAISDIRSKEPRVKFIDIDDPKYFLIARRLKEGETDNSDGSMSSEVLMKAPGYTWAYDKTRVESVAWFEKEKHTEPTYHYETLEWTSRNMWKRSRNTIRYSELYNDRYAMLMDRFPTKRMDAYASNEVYYTWPTDDVEETTTFTAPVEKFSPQGCCVM